MSDKEFESKEFDLNFSQEIYDFIFNPENKINFHTEIVHQHPSNERIQDAIERLKTAANNSK